MSTVYRQQVTEPAAIFPASAPACQQGTAHRAFFRWLILWRVCLVVLPPPLNPAPIAAEPSCSSCPLRLIFLPAVWADLFWMLPVSPLFRYFLLMVFLPAPVAAKPPPPPWPLCLFYLVPTLRTDIYGYSVMSFCTVVPVPTRIAAEFLPRDVACWDEAFAAIQAFFFFSHSYAPPFFHSTMGV